MIITLVTAMVGGLGAAARFALDAALARRLQGSGSRLMIINLSGSALLGLLTGLALGRLVSASIAMLLGTGFSAATPRSVQQAWPRSSCSSSEAGLSRWPRASACWSVQSPPLRSA
jgi:hypothetical protein